MPCDIAEWALVERVSISAMVPPARCGDEILSGLVQIDPASIIPMFRRHGTSASTATVRHIRRADEEWRFVTEPEGGIEVTSEDLVITAAELARFEDEHDILRRAGGGAGAPAKYDWDGMYLQIITRIHNQGLPETQAAFVAEVQEWFMRRSEAGDAPDERTIRRRLTPIWQALRDAA